MPSIESSQRATKFIFSAAKLELLVVLETVSYKLHYFISHSGNKNKNPFQLILTAKRLTISKKVFLPHFPNKAKNFFEYSVAFCAEVLSNIFFLFFIVLHGLFLITTFHYKNKLPPPSKIQFINKTVSNSFRLDDNKVCFHRLTYQPKLITIYFYLIHLFPYLCRIASMLF